MQVFFLENFSICLLKQKDLKVKIKFLEKNKNNNNEIDPSNYQSVLDSTTLPVGGNS